MFRSSKEKGREFPRGGKEGAILANRVDSQKFWLVEGPSASGGSGKLLRRNLRKKKM